MASQLLGIKTRFTNDLGSPLVGGQVYTYFAGTSTNQDSYSDAALTVPNTNPVILDDTGSADIFLKGAYRIRVFDKSGRFIEEQDNVTQAASGLDAQELTDRVNVIDSDLSKVKSDTGITVTPKNGTLPIDQSVKNAQTISMVEYGAIGDGITNDTAAFALLESNVTGRVIDLQGKTHAVARAATKNTYINGLWLIDGVQIPINGELIAESAKAFDVKECSKDSNVSLYRMFNAAGAGGNKTIQSAVQDAAGTLYTNHNTTRAPDTTGVSVWNSYNSDSPVVTNSTAFQASDDRLGHQGAAILFSKSLNTNLILTTSPPIAEGVQYHPDFDYSVGGGYGVVAFSFKPETSGEISKPVQYRVLQSSITSTSSTTPTVTSDGKWLIIKHSSEGQNGRQYFRVFSTDLFDSAVDIDISNKYTHEFSFVVSDLLLSGDAIHSLSGFCSDGNHLYITLAGYRAPITQAKYLLSCDLLGSKLEIAKGNYFEHAVQRDSGTVPTFIETQGMLIVNYKGVSYLGCVVVSDTPNHSTTSRFSAVYLLGAQKERRVSNTSGLNIYESGSTPKSPIKMRVQQYSVDGVLQDAGLVFDNNGRGSNNLFAFMRNGVVALKAYSSTSNLAITATEAKRLILGATSNATFGTDWNWFIDPSSGDFKPYGANKYSLGSATDDIKNTYLHAAPIISSDERLKQDFRKLKAVEKKAAIEIKESVCLYKMKDSVAEKGDGARWHVGVKAQQIVSIMESHGLEPFDYGFICHDEWEAQEADIDDDGNEVQAAREAGDKYAVRYDELAMFILAAI